MTQLASTLSAKIPKNFDHKVERPILKWSKARTTRLKCACCKLQDFLIKIITAN